MKKTLTLFSGIVFLIAILVAGCNSPGADKKGATESPETKDETKALRKETVAIKLDTVIEVREKKHLYLVDAVHRDIDSMFITDVHRGDTVIWEIKLNSGIEEIKDVKGVHNYWIFREDPHQDPMGNWILIIPDDILDCTMEEYKIKYTTEKGESATVYETDPFLRIPPPSGE